MGLIQKKASEHSNSFALTMTPLSAHWYPDRLTHTTPQPHLWGPCIAFQGSWRCPCPAPSAQCCRVVRSRPCTTPGWWIAWRDLGSSPSAHRSPCRSKPCLRAHHLLQGLPDILPCPKNTCGQHKHLQSNPQVFKTQDVTPHYLKIPKKKPCGVCGIGMPQSTPLLCWCKWLGGFCGWTCQHRRRIQWRRWCAQGGESHDIASQQDGASTKDCQHEAGAHVEEIPHGSNPTWQK